MLPMDHTLVDLWSKSSLTISSYSSSESEFDSHDFFY